MSDPASSSSTLAPALAGLALLISSGHLAYAMTRTPQAPAASAEVATKAGEVSNAADCRCDDAALRSEMVDLRRAIRALEAEAAKTPAVRTASPSDTPIESRVAAPQARTPTEHELSIAVSADSSLPKIDVFLDPPPGVEMEQQTDGSIKAKATDPEMAGREFVVVGLTKSGEATLIRLTAR